jgi:hypothetical protein
MVSGMDDGIDMAMNMLAVAFRQPVDLPPSACLTWHPEFSPFAMIGQTISHYRNDPIMLECLCSDDLVVINPLNKFMHSISVVSEGKHCSHHILI